MQTPTSETEIKFRYLSICVHHYTLRAPCPEGQGNRPLPPGVGRFGSLLQQLKCGIFWRTAVDLQGLSTWTKMPAIAAMRACLELSVRSVMVVPLVRIPNHPPTTKPSWQCPCTRTSLRGMSTVGPLICSDVTPNSDLC